MNHSGATRNIKKVECSEVETGKESSVIEKEIVIDNIDPNLQSSNYNVDDSHDEREVNRVIQTYEKMKTEDPELLEEIIYANKEILELCSKDKNEREDIKKLEEMYSDLEEINEDFLFWCSHKAIRIAIVDNKNIDIAHFFLVKKGYKLYNKIVHKNIIHDYFKSLSNLTMEEFEDESNKYMTLLEFILFYGKADINERDDNLQNTPLHFAVLYKQIQFLIFLLNHKDIKLSIQNKYGDTPLDFALESFKRSEDVTINAEIIKLLLEYGAEPNTQKNMFDDI